MVQAMSLFNQLLRHFPNLEFAALVKKHRAERAAKGFSCRTQLVAMLFCQLAHADSLRGNEFLGSIARLRFTDITSLKSLPLRRKCSIEMLYHRTVNSLLTVL